MSKIHRCGDSLDCYIVPVFTSGVLGDGNSGTGRKFTLRSYCGEDEGMCLGAMPREMGGHDVCCRSTEGAEGEMKSVL